MSPERCGTCRESVKQRTMQEALAKACAQCSTTLEHCGIMLIASSNAYCDGSDEDITCVEGTWLVDEMGELDDAYYDDDNDDDDDCGGEDYDYSDTRNMVIIAAANVLKKHPEARIVTL